MKKVKAKIFVDDRQIIFNAPYYAAPWIVFQEEGMNTAVLAKGHFLSYSNLSEDGKSELALGVFIDVCNEYGIILDGIPDGLKTID